MEKETSSKILSLIITVIVVVLSLVRHVDFANVGVFAGCPLSSHFLYPFFHVNIIHALLNAWCLLCIVFFYGMPARRIFLAYLVATAYPAWLFPAVSLPTVGLSGVVFALTGMLSFSVRRRLYYQAWMWTFLIAGFFLPGTNAWVHLWCYACGIAAAFLVHPIKKGRGG